MFKMKQILLGIGNLKMKRTFYEPDDVWSIWVEQFAPSQNIVRLPWNEKHYFHDNCIGEWINSNPTWPLWKFIVTEEVLHKYVEKQELKERNQHIIIE